MRRIDPQSSSCRIFTFREGVLAAVGHDLELAVGVFEVEVDEEHGTLDARFDARSIDVLHAISDGRPDPNALSARDRATIGKHLQRDVLKTARHTEIRYRGRFERKADSARIAGSLELVGRSGDVVVEAVERDGRWHAEVSLHQPDFGIAPFRALMGTLRIRPTVVVRVEGKLEP